jgi:hypothetical protein
VVCPARDTGVALVLTRLDTAAMNLFLTDLLQAVAPGAHSSDQIGEAFFCFPEPADAEPEKEGCNTDARRQTR